MPEVAIKGAKIQNSIAPNHIRIKKLNPDTIPPYSSYYYDYINATIEGEISEGSTNVFVNGKEVAFSGAKTTERDDYQLPGGWSYDSGAHTSTNGSVKNGSPTVFINGKPLARKSDSIETHAGSSAIITDGSSNVFAN
ncbi:PAAR domain-containing protein [Lysinibacillus sp. FSL W8-0992]|uniref:PAAR domain-containing protein n=1 Tax=Lysinibacillus sp. FSL W8-0992 TaxID=2954643 RepID=UPI0030F87481